MIDIEALGLVFDRTHGDVVYAASQVRKVKEHGIGSLTPDEVTEWFKGLKGRYTKTDLNRVESAVQIIADNLFKYGYWAKVSTRGWEYLDVPDDPEMARYCNNVWLIIQAYFVMLTSPALPDDMERLTFGGANDVERILFDVASLFNNMLRTVDFAWTLGMAHTGIYGGY